MDFQNSNYVFASLYYKSNGLLALHTLPIDYFILRICDGFCFKIETDGDVVIKEMNILIYLLYRDQHSRPPETQPRVDLKGYAYLRISIIQLVDYV